MRKEKSMQNMQSKRIKTFCVLFALSAVFAVSTATAVFAADAYPSKPVRLIAPFAPGGSTDILGRLIAARLSERLGKQVVVENRPGGGCVVGTELAAKSAPDGYTLLIITSAHAVQPAFQKLPYDALKSFTPLALVGTGPYVLTVNSSVPVHSVKEFIALAKQKPGQLAFSCSGAGGSSHIGIELFKMMADIDVKVVQFKGAGPALIDEVGGHSHASLLSLVTPLPQIKSGKLRALATGGAKRSALLPDVPTIAESGVPGYSLAQWYGMLAPAGVPAPIVDRLTNELKAILTSDAVKKQFLNEGTEADYMDPAEFGPFIAENIAKFTSIVKTANIKLD